MKKFRLLIALFVLGVQVANAQTDSTNILLYDSFVERGAWTEMSYKKKSNVDINTKRGIITLKSKANKLAAYDAKTHLFTDMNPAENFEVKCSMDVIGIKKGNMVGMIFDYMDDMNFSVVGIDCAHAYFQKYSEGKLVGEMICFYTVDKKRSVMWELALKNTDGKLEFIVNDAVLFELRHREITSSGVGFYTYGKQSAKFHDLTILQ